MRCVLPHADDAKTKIADTVVAMTNDFLDQRVDLLTHDIRVDAERRAATIGLGGPICAC
jgi:hypothetical protein